MKIYTHKLTGNKMRLKTPHDNVGCFIMIDENNNDIMEWNKFLCEDTCKIAICSFENVEELHNELRTPKA